MKKGKESKKMDRSEPKKSDPMKMTLKNGYLPTMDRLDFPVVLQKEEGEKPRKSKVTQKGGEQETKPVKK